MSDLKTVSKEIQDYVREGRTGPTLAAGIVVQVAVEWETKHRAGVKDKPAFETWLRSLLGRGATLRYFDLRHKAAERFGGTSKGSALMVEHSGLVWLSGRVADDKLAKFKGILGQAFLNNYKQPLSIVQVGRVFEKALGPLPKREKVSCVNCMALRAEIERLRKQSRTSESK